MTTATDPFQPRCHGEQVGHVRQVDRQTVQQWLPLLDEWLLPDQFYGVQQTWPQLYRSDGEGLFFVLLDPSPAGGDRLLSHCACRLVTVHAANGPLRVCLLGSVATAPECRGQGHASRVLTAALATVESRCDAVLLWAERPDLYARHDFVAGREETCLVLARRPRRGGATVRLAEVGDHPAMFALHEQKPDRVQRSAHVMSGLLTTPGMTTVVLEENGVIVAYACCGKGADLQGYWHELGGSDDAVTRLLPAAMHVVNQIDAIVLVPPYRPTLQERLGALVTSQCQVPGPMVRARDGGPLHFWIDGLDSV